MEGDKHGKDLACEGFCAHIRAYATYSKELKKMFNVRVSIRAVVRVRVRVSVRARVRSSGSKLFDATD